MTTKNGGKNVKSSKKAEEDDSAIVSQPGPSERQPNVDMRSDPSTSYPTPDTQNSKELGRVIV